jgi:hypothetical protein
MQSPWRSGWRIPLPGGIELRLLAYWLASLAAIGLLGRLPLLGALVSTVPASLRLLALTLAAAWLLSRWELDGLRLGFLGFDSRRNGRLSIITADLRGQTHRRVVGGLRMNGENRRRTPDGPVWTKIP